MLKSGSLRLLEIPCGGVHEVCRAWMSLAVAMVTHDSNEGGLVVSIEVPWCDASSLAFVCVCVGGFFIIRVCLCLTRVAVVTVCVFTHI